MSPDRTAALPNLSTAEATPRFSAVVVTYNEARYLSSCLESLRFCDEVIVTDLGSDDESVDVARRHGAIVRHAEWVATVEQIRPQIACQARNDWLVFLDPDEALPAGIEVDLRELIAANEEAGFIRVPIQFFFRGKPLECTVWGVNSEKTCVVHRKRVSLLPEVHRGTRLLDGYSKVRVARRSFEYCILHQWCDDWGHLIDKHSRYLKNEGRSRFTAGQKFSWSRMVFAGMRALKVNLIDCRGIRGGPTGWGLSIFYAWYTMASWNALRKYIPPIASEKGEGDESESVAADDERERDDA